MQNQERAGVKFPSRASRRLVEDYVLKVAPALENDFCIAILVPWSHSVDLPAKVIAPYPCNEATWDQEDILRAGRECGSVLVVATFELNYEKKVLRRLLDMFEKVAAPTVVALQLLEFPKETSNEYASVILMRHEALLSVGCSAVIVDPDPHHERLMLKIQQELAIIQINAARTEQMFPLGKEDLEDVERQHRELLWNAVPKAFLPSFPPMNPRLKEDGKRVDKYQLLDRYQTHSSSNQLLLAVREGDDQRVVVKALDKRVYTGASDLEGIYREFRFLTEFRHPNIVQCFEALHSPSAIYIILECGGLMNLQRFVEDQPGWRLDASLAFDCMRQVSSGLAFCHSQNVAHREVCLRHIAIEDIDSSNDRVECRLVDFFTALKCQKKTASSVVCGDMPFMAPEMATGGPYFPKLVDCWSFGAMMLESVGGLETMSRAVGFDDDDDLHACGVMVFRHFSEAGSHARALSWQGGVRSTETVTVLEAAMRTNAQERATMEDLHRILSQENGEENLDAVPEQVQPVLGDAWY